MIGNQLGKAQLGSLWLIGGGAIPYYPQPDPSEFDYCKTIVIDHTKVTADLTDFPLMLAGIYPYLATVANGGGVKNANGFDIVFTSDEEGTSIMKYERDYWDPVTGKSLFWVKIPSLSHTSDTTIYLWYGHADATVDRADPTNLWDADFCGVWHFSESATPYKDSSGRGNHMGLIYGTGESQVDGTLGGKAISFSGQELTAGNPTAFPSGTGPKTAEAWFYGGSGDYWETGEITGFGDNTADYKRFGIAYSTNVLNEGRFQIECRNKTREYVKEKENDWNHIAVTIPDGGDLSSAKMYWNGEEVTVTGDTGTVDVSNYEVTASGIAGTSHVGLWNGRLDELRWSKVVRSADWIATQYANQKSPSTFYSISDASGSLMINPDLRGGFPPFLSGGGF